MLPTFTDPSLLFTAVTRGDEETLCHALDAGADLNASRAGHEDFALWKGDVAQNRELIYQTEAFHWRETLLEVAVNVGNVALVRLLLERGAKPEERALLRALQKNDLILLHLLLKGGANPDAFVTVPEIVEDHGSYFGYPTQDLKPVKRHLLHFASSEAARLLVERRAYASQSDIAGAVAAGDWAGARAAFVREGGFTNEKAQERAWVAVLRAAYDNEHANDEQTGRAAFRREVAYHYLLWSLRLIYETETLAGNEMHFRECAARFSRRYPLVAPFHPFYPVVLNGLQMVADADDATFLNQLITISPDNRRIRSLAVPFKQTKGGACRRLLVARGLLNADDFSPYTLE